MFPIPNAATAFSGFGFEAIWTDLVQRNDMPSTIVLLLQNLLYHIIGGAPSLLESELTFKNTSSFGGIAQPIYMFVNV